MHSLLGELEAIAKHGKPLVSQLPTTHLRQSLGRILQAGSCKNESGLKKLAHMSSQLYIALYHAGGSSCNDVGGSLLLFDIIITTPRFLH